MAPANPGNDELLRELERIERAGGSGRRAGSRGKAPVVVVAAIVVAAAVAFCLWWFVLPPDYSAYASDEVRISGLTDEPVTLAISDLEALGCERVSASGTNAMGSKSTAEGYGPTLDTLLAAYGHERGDFAKVRFYCRDDYKVVLKRSDIESHDTIVLAIADDHGPLRESSRPLRLLIPGGNANQWCYAMASIEFLETDPGVERDSTEKAQGQR